MIWEELWGSRHQGCFGTQCLDYLTARQNHCHRHPILGKCWYSSILIILLLYCSDSFIDWSNRKITEMKAREGTRLFYYSFNHSARAQNLLPPSSLILILTSSSFLLWSCAFLASSRLYFNATICSCSAITSCCLCSCVRLFVCVIVFGRLFV